MPLQRVSYVRTEQQDTEIYVTVVVYGPKICSDYET